jgi:hypothetical protein
MKTFAFLMLPIICLLASCKEPIDRAQLHGYIGTEKFSVDAGHIGAVNADINYMPAYEIRAEVNGEDSLFITFVGVTMGGFKYFVPGKGLNMATFFDASQLKYYSTHLSPEGYGKLGLEQAGGKISGNVDLVLFDENGEESIAVTNLSFHQLPVRSGQIKQVGQYVEFLHGETPNWSRKFKAELKNGVVQFTTKTSQHNQLQVELQHDIGPGTYDLPSDEVLISLIDSTGEMAANNGSLKVIRHDSAANYVEARFDVISSTASRFQTNFELRSGTVHFTYWE